MKLDADNNIVCPACGSWQMRYGTLKVFSREPDANVTTKVVVDDDGKASVRLVPSFQSGNPSLREDGVLWVFNCNACNESFRLEIAIAKGAVQFQWCERGRRFEHDPV